MFQTVHASQELSTSPPISTLSNCHAAPPEGRNMRSSSWSRIAGGYSTKRRAAAFADSPPTPGGNQGTTISTKASQAEHPCIHRLSACTIPLTNHPNQGLSRGSKDGGGQDSRIELGFEG